MRNLNQKDLEAYEGEYSKEEKEILVLTSDSTGGACKFHDSWDSSKYFWAYVDVSSNELKKGDGRINWLISEEDRRKNGFTWPYKFENGVIYRLKVRELLDKTVQKGMMPSYYNRFMVVDVLEKNARHHKLLAVLAEHQKAVFIKDKILGKFGLNRDFSAFGGEINWLGKEVGASMDVDIDDKSSWTKAMNTLRILFEQQQQKDAEFRAFAAEKLTDLANDWRQDGAEISKENFAKRISLSEVCVDPQGSYVAYFNDDSMFLRHAVTVYGHIEKGLESASVEG